MKSPTLLLLATGVITAVSWAPVQAALVFATNPSGALTMFQHVTLGIPFRVEAAPFRVTGFGYFDYLSDGLTDAQDVGIYNLGGVLLASATIPSGSSPPLHDEARWADLNTPVTLEANTSYMLAFTTRTGFDYYEAGFPGDVTIAPAFSLQSTIHFYDGWGSGDDNLNYPGTQYSVMTYWPFGGNFEGEVVPEPAAAGFLLGLACLAAGSRRRR